MSKGGSGTPACIRTCRRAILSRTASTPSWSTGWTSTTGRGDKESLDRAVANAYYGLLYWCPKQLSWVKNPTQCAHSEQQHFNQYSVYCYGNRKIQCLDRLFKKTGNPLFEQLKNRVMQLNFYAQVVDGPYKAP